MAAAVAVGGLARLAAAAAARLAAAESANPGMYQKAMDYVKRTTGGAIASVPQIAAYAGQNPQQLAVLARGMVTAGIRPDEIFPSALVNEIRDRRVQMIWNEMKAEFQKAYGPLDAASTIKAVDPIARVAEAMKNISDLERSFNRVPGDDAWVRRFHVQLKMFLASDDALIEQALFLRKLN